MNKEEEEEIGLASWFALAFFGLFVFWFVCGCASNANPREDSNHYRAEAQTYPCPECGYKIDINNVNQNIRMGNTCPSCGKTFFYTPTAESSKAENYQRGYGHYGPRNYGPTSVYQSETRYKRLEKRWYSFKENKWGFLESWGSFRDSQTNTTSFVPHWTTRRYHYP